MSPDHEVFHPRPVSIRGGSWMECYTPYFVGNRVGSTFWIQNLAQWCGFRTRLSARANQSRHTTEVTNEV